MLAYAYAVAGRAADARRTLDTMRARAGGARPASGAVAVTLDVLGDHEAAVAMRADAAAKHDVWLVQFPQEPRYDRLRRDARVAAVLGRLGAAVR
jgi:hypothetical protein